MQVSLTHAEVQAAVVALLKKRGVEVDGHNIAVSFSMGRKNTSLTATVEVNDPEVKVLPATSNEEWPAETLIPNATTLDAMNESKDSAAPAASSVSANPETETPSTVQAPVTEPEAKDPPSEASDSPFQAPAAEVPKSLFSS